MSESDLTANNNTGGRTCLYATADFGFIFLLALLLLKIILMRIGHVGFVDLPVDV